MIRPVTAALPASSETASPLAPDQASADAAGRVYGRSFWAAYASNTLVCVGLALLFRYADFIAVLGGTELHLGWIVGAGMIGSILMRLSMGDWIDRYGPRRVWTTSLGVFAAACLAHLAVTRCDGAAIYALRIALFTSLAGVFGSSMSLVAGRSSITKMAEMVGMLGTSGFLGIMTGTLLGDLLCGAEPSVVGTTRMFVAASLLGLAAMPFAWRAASESFVPSREARLPLWRVLQRHFPLPLAAVGMVGGAVLAFPQIFLRTYAAALDIPRLGGFFTAVAVVAVATRFATRNLPSRVGLPPLILFSLSAMAVAQMLFLVVRTEGQLLFPAVAHGLGQAILFPTVTAAGAGAFPLRYRGVAMVVMLATFDLGQLIGSPIAGAILHYGPQIGLPGYPTLFAAMGLALLISGGLYAGVLLRGRWRCVATPPGEPRLSLPERSARMEQVRVSSLRSPLAASAGLSGPPPIERERPCESPGVQR
jgi:MFS family permease